MGLNLINHTGNLSILKHRTLPMIMTGEFDFLDVSNLIQVCMARL